MLPRTAGSAAGVLAVAISLPLEIGLADRNLDAAREQVRFSTASSGGDVEQAAEQRVLARAPPATPIALRRGP